ncbi:MAG: DUF4199 family protein [Muribaculaceae bacterium]|nr:DUF4199 family protein [Muribaculaceae bacterium]
MQENDNVIKRGIDNAVPMALYTTGISLASIYCDRVPMLSVVAMVMLFMGPMLIYTLQRRFFIENEGECTMGMLLRMNIVAIFFGTVFTLLVTYMTLEYLRPGFLYDQVQSLIDVYNTMPELKNSELKTELQALVDNNLLPTPFYYALNLFAMTNASGMVVGLLTAALAARPVAIK